MVTKNTDQEQVLARLDSLLREVWDQHPAHVPIQSDMSFLNLGVDSLTLVLLLDKVASEFHIEWTEETSPGAASSLRSISALVVRRNSHDAD
ncbi:phosphopantetheine-binding protein [Streptomyces aquilus]|uniref:phosphopantetheine-binding protein n=1 Tax=Streptomyces aquilus TaxID=2548456 RepID=UPI0036C245B8